MNCRAVEHPKPHPRYAKFPHIKYNYESESVDDMFFAGTSTHSLDFRKSAGGFIHGFRYTSEFQSNFMITLYPESIHQQKNLPFSLP